MVEPNAPGTRLRALIVEDDPVLGHMLETSLTADFETVRVSTSADALRALSDPYHVILMDLVLQDGTGVDILLGLQLNLTEGKLPPPVVVLSAYASEVDLTVYDHLVAAKLMKPASIKDIQDTLRTSAQHGMKVRPLAPRGTPVVLLVDEDPFILSHLGGYLTHAGYRVLTASRPSAAITMLRKSRPDLIVCDWMLPEMSGAEFLAQVRELAAGIPTILMSELATPEMFDHARQAGVARCLTNPMDLGALEQAISELLHKMDHGTYHNRADTAKTGLSPAYLAIHGHSETISFAREMVVRVARSDSPVLITGETGTGKELFARAVHELSPRAAGPFVAINAAAIPDTLMESELFGYEPGAFTGALRKGHKGKLREADGGTLFLDEIGDLPTALQAKLLRVLQDGMIPALGGATYKVDVRVVTATHHDLRNSRDRFRQDLLYRLGVLTLDLPPLRDRIGDVERLAVLHMQRLGAKYRRTGMEITRGALRLLTTYQWPGNVRELNNVMEHCFAFSDGNVIDTPQLPGYLRQAVQDKSFPDLDFRERERILEAIRVSGGNRSRAADLLGISRALLYTKLKRHSIPTDHQEYDARKRDSEEEAN